MSSFLVKLVPAPPRPCWLPLAVPGAGTRQQTSAGAGQVAQKSGLSWTLPAGPGRAFLFGLSACRDSELCLQHFPRTSPAPRCRRQSSRVTLVAAEEMEAKCP